MFLADEQVDPTSLRQGDILGPLPFPLLSVGSLAIIGQLQNGPIQSPFPAITPAPRPHRNDQNYFTGQMLMRSCFCAVISHCCELEPRNNKLILPAFSVARLVPIKQSILDSPEKLESLKENRDPRLQPPGFLDYFYVAAHERIQNQEWMVDYSQIASIMGTEFPAILAHRILQMNDRSRVKFKIKLAVYFGRITDEEAANGIGNPWL